MSRLLARLSFRLPGFRPSRVGEVLVREGLITTGQLERTLALQRERHRPLGQLIVEQGLASETEVVGAIARHYRVDVNSLSENIPELIHRRTSAWRTLSRWRRGIQMRLSVAVIVVAWVGMLSLSLVLLSRQSDDLRLQAVRMGALSLRLLATNAEDALHSGQFDSLQRLVRSVAATDGMLYGAVVDANSVIRAHSTPGQVGAKLPDFKPLGAILQHDDIAAFVTRSPEGADVLQLTKRLMDGDRMLGEVHLGVSQRFIHNRIRSQTTLVVLLSLLVLAFGIALASHLGGSMAGPVAGLLHAALAQGREHLTHGPTTKGRHALDDLARSFDAISGEARDRAVMERSLGRYVGREVLDLIKTNPDQAWLQSARSEATILFTDVRGFTSVAEAREPEEIVEALNEYFALTCQAVRDAGGYVDKYVGDAVLAVFGVPAAADDHAQRAVRAAVAMQKAFKRRARQTRNPLLHRVGVGINTGIVVSGNIGTEHKLEYAVIGDAVNVASRLNGLADAGEIIISHSVYEGLPRHLVTVKELPPQRVKGRNEPVTAYKVLRTDV